MRLYIARVLATGGAILILHIGALGAPAGQDDVPHGLLSQRGEAPRTHVWTGRPQPSPPAHNTAP